jgi:hypothetical protein
MNKRADRIEFKAQVEQRHEANPLLKVPGDVAVVHRGVLRSLVLACPDGCGELLTINLDARAGKAWRVYGTHGELSLFPSVWRETGCKSHFILWRSKIYWCDWNEELDTPLADVLEQVRGHLSSELVSYVDIAEALQLVPWAVLSACHLLARQGVAQQGRNKKQGHFKRAEPGS